MQTFFLTPYTVSLIQHCQGISNLFHLNVFFFAGVLSLPLLTLFFARPIFKANIAHACLLFYMEYINVVTSFLDLGLL